MNNNSADEFFTWLGKCIIAWAQVEEHLFEICVHSLGGTRHRVAIVYYRTPTLNGRLELTNELARTILPARDPPAGGRDHPDTKKWDELRKQISALLRNLRCEDEVACPLGYCNCCRIDNSLRNSRHDRGIDNA